MHLYSGRTYYPCDPHPDEIEIEDIAHALSNICRFSGHSLRFLSVAEHSYHCSLIVPQEHALEALLHDSAEAYLGDVIRPLKLLSEFAAFYKPLEVQNERAIAERFGLNYPWPASVKRADEAMVALELQQNIAATDKGSLHDCSEIANVELLYLDPLSARQLFMWRFVSLFAKRGISGNV